MCTVVDQALINVTRQVVEAFLVAGKTFSSGDVSNRVKKAIPTARHGDVAEVVRDLSGNFMYGNRLNAAQVDDYGVTTLYPSFAPNGVFVYHVSGEDVSNYQFPKLVAPVNVVDEDDEDEDDDATEILRLHTESQGRIRVPAIVVQDIINNGPVKVTVDENDSDVFVLSR